MADRSAGLSALFEPLWPKRRSVIRTLSFGLCTALSTIGLAATSAWLIVRAAQRPSVFSLAVVMGFVQLFALTKAVTRYLERLSTHDTALRLLRETRRSVFQAIGRIVPGGLGARHDHAITTSAVDDVDTLEHFYVGVLPPLVVGTIVAIVAIVVAGLLSPAGGLALCIGLVLSAGIIPVVAHKIAQGPNAKIQSLNLEQGVLIDALVTSGVELSTSPALGRMLRELDDLDAARARALSSLAWRRGSIGAAGVLTTGLTVAVLAVASSDAVSRGGLAVTAIAVLPLLALGAFEVTTALAQAASDLPNDLAAARRLQALVTQESAWPDPEKPAPDVPGDQGLHVRDVELGFGIRGSLLREVNLDLDQRQRIAIVGPSGSGKSTLLNALARFVPPRAGRITLGETPIDQLRGTQVRSQVGTMDQEPHLFHSTLAANVRLARPDAADSEIDWALRSAGLAELIDDDPAGLQLEVGEEGTRLSGGERQRVGLARLLLAKPPIVVLDEPTEGLDEVTARRVMRNIDTALGDRALLVVTHRESDASTANDVYEISSGAMVLEEH